MNSFILSEILFAVVWIIALFVMREFIIAKDGMLRKLMIAYFFVEFLTYFGTSIYFLGVREGWNKLPMEQWRVIVILPKVAIKLWLLSWLITNRKK
jgi:hypothetical protein